MMTIHEYARHVVAQKDGIDDELKHVAYVLINDRSIQESDDFEAIIKALEPHYMASRKRLNMFRNRYRIYRYNSCKQSSKRLSQELKARQSYRKKQEQ